MKEKTSIWILIIIIISVPTSIVISLWFFMNPETYWQRIFQFFISIPIYIISMYITYKICEIIDDIFQIEA